MDKLNRTPLRILSYYFQNITRTKHLLFLMAEPLLRRFCLAIFCLWSIEFLLVKENHVLLYELFHLFGIDDIKCAYSDLAGGRVVPHEPAILLEAQED